MRKLLIPALILTTAGTFLPAQNQQLDPSKLLDRMSGSWVLKGMIAGKPVTHDVEANWVLRHEYLQIHEVSREKDPDGQASYEAIILLSWDPKASQYTCLWLDSTSGAGLTNGVTCKASQAPDSIPLIFTLSPTESIHTAFTYNEAKDTWHWTIDDIANGKTDHFADVELTRKK
jgi:hypothetical protein